MVVGMMFAFGGVPDQEGLENPSFKRVALPFWGHKMSKRMLEYLVCHYELARQNMGIDRVLQQPVSLGYQET